jgi:large subunit ribosomal protein L25
MVDEDVVKAEARVVRGSAGAGRLRRAGLIPGVVYGGREPPRAVQVTAHALEQALRRHTSENVVIGLEIGGEGVSKVLVKEVQHHPLSGALLHADFQEVAMDKVLRVMIPVELTGVPVGVARDGGVLEQHVREVEVQCLPGDIVEVFEHDVSGLGIHQSVTVSELKVDAERFEVLSDGGITVANVVPPRVQAEEEEAPEAEAEETPEEAAEPEVITERKPEGEGR